MQAAVVTGCTGAVGLGLIDALMKNNVKVIAVVRKDSKRSYRIKESHSLKKVECDLSELDKLPQLVQATGIKPDVFYHFGWDGTFGDCRNDMYIQNMNVKYALDAVNAAAVMGCSAFIGAGSQAEYGPMDVPRIAPDSPVHPTTPYGASKLAANQLSFMLCKELGMEWIWPRIFSVYGIYEKETTMIASGLRKMLKGEKTEFTPAEQRWDYLYSKDYLIGEKGRDGAVYCVGSGQAHPLWEYIMQMAELTGADSPGIGARPYPPGAVRNLCADIDSLTKDTGFVPEYTFEEGIKETLCWLESQNTGDRK